MSVDNVITLTGREEITTGLSLSSTIAELIQDLKLSLPCHYSNQVKINYLTKYWKGGQPILDRVKEVRDDIDNKVIINLAQSATRQIVGYTFGKPIEFIHQLEDDSDEMRILNNCFKVEHKDLVDNEIFIDCSVCGLGYGIILPYKGYKKSDYDMSKSPFSVSRLNPSNTFCVYSTEIPSYVVYSVALHEVKMYDAKGDVQTYTVFNIYHGNNEYKFKVLGSSPTEITIEDMMDEPRTTLLGNPIIEYRNNSNMSGDWEIAISIIDAINVVASDSVNDIVQFVQSLLVFINAELDEEKAAELKASKMLSLLAPDGLHADVKYISEQLDGAAVHQLREWLEGEFNNIVGIPDRKTRGGGGGDTGEAVKLRDGWGDLEILARNKEPYVRKGQMDLLRFAIPTLMTYNLISDLKLYDVEIKFTRNKSDNLLNKTQSYSTLISTETITPEDAITICDFVNDAKEIASKGKAYWEENSKEESMQTTTTEVDVINENEE